MVAEIDGAEEEDYHSKHAAFKSFFFNSCHLGSRWFLSTKICFNCAGFESNNWEQIVDSFNVWIIAFLYFGHNREYDDVENDDKEGIEPDKVWNVELCLDVLCLVTSSDHVSHIDQVQGHENPSDDTCLGQSLHKDHWEYNDVSENSKYNLLESWEVVIDLSHLLL